MEPSKISVYCVFVEGCYIRKSALCTVIQDGQNILNFTV